MGWLSDLASPISSAIGAAGSYFGQQSANKANRKLQRKQLDWEAMMSNTAVQRRTDDLRAAGINPLLAAGQAAEVPNVAPARMESETRDAAPLVASSAEKFAQVALARSQARKNDAEASVTEDSHDAWVGRAGLEVDKVAAEIDNINNDTDLKYWSVAVKKIEGQIKNVDLERIRAMLPLITRKMEAETEKAEAGVPEAQRRAEAWKSILGAFAAHADLVIPSVNSALGAGALGQITRFVRGGNRVKGGGLPGRKRPNLGTEQPRGEKPPPGSWERFLSE